MCLLSEFRRINLFDDISFIWFICFVDEDDTIKDRNVFQDESAVSKLLAHLPDMVINYNQKVLMPAKKECIGVTMFADISGQQTIDKRYFCPPVAFP